MSVGYESNFVCNPTWERGLYERELGFPEFISEPEKVEKVQEEETKVKKFVVFDDKGGWSTTVSAESLEKALELVTEDAEGDYAWENGCSVNIGEVVFEGKIKSVAVSNVVEALDTEEEVERVQPLPIGTRLRAKVNHPVASDLLVGDVAEVVSQEEPGSCRARKIGGDWSFLYGTGFSTDEFYRIWEVVENADNFSEEEEDLSSDTIGELPVGTILEALVDYPVCILSLEKGGLVVVCENGCCKLLSDPKTVRHYGSGYSLKEFNQTWKIVYKP
jgi:hypothetical protein